MHRPIAILLASALLPLTTASNSSSTLARATAVSIEGERFLINGRPTYEGRVWRPEGGEDEYPIEGLLMNSRMVQGIFDDLNPETRERWAYRDNGVWNPDRNTDEFIAAMPSWREHGLLAFTLNLQGGSPEGYSEVQPWENNAYEPDGALRPAFLERCARILDAADRLGMLVILGYFYFGQDERLKDEAAVVRAVDNVTDWLLDGGWSNVLVEVNNECDVRHYDHPILQPERVHELIERVKSRQREGRRLLVSTSYAGGKLPSETVVQASDYVLLHGNGVRQPERMAELIRETRLRTGDNPKPIVNNEDDRPWRDDHQGFGDRGNNCVVCVENYASWGYFDFRQVGEPFEEGFQGVPVDWTIGSDRKRAFFDLLKRITGGE